MGVHLEHLLSLSLSLSRSLSLSVSSSMRVDLEHNAREYELLPEIMISDCISRVIQPSFLSLGPVGM
jgi:hypothetical protein